MSDITENSIQSSNSPKNDDQTLEQEAKDYTEFLKVYYTKYKRYKIILDAIQECIEDENNLDQELRKKIEAILLEQEVSQVRLGQEDLCPILGASLGNLTLTYMESDKLCSCLKSKLINNFQNVYLNSLDTNTDSPLGLTYEDSLQINLRTKLAQEQDLNQKNQICLLELLENIKSLRLKEIPHVIQNRYEETVLKMRINSLKAHLAKNKHKIDVFMETKSSLQAYEVIINDLKLQQQNLLKEIEKLKELKGKYVEVASKEYDEILKSYLQYKMSFEKKKQMCELCK